MEERKKKCIGEMSCGRVLPISSFYTKGKGKYDSKCKDCAKKWRNHRYKEKQKKRIKQKKRRRSTRTLDLGEYNIIEQPLQISKDSEVKLLQDFIEAVI
jgi:hypothetical protein